MRELPNVGDRVSWETIDGTRYEGIVIELDSNVVVVRCDDGTEAMYEG